LNLNSLWRILRVCSRRILNIIVAFENASRPKKNRLKCPAGVSALDHQATLAALWVLISTISKKIVSTHNPAFSSISYNNRKFPVCGLRTVNGEPLISMSGLMSNREQALQINTTQFRHRNSSTPAYTSSLLAAHLFYWLRPCVDAPGLPKTSYNDGFIAWRRRCSRLLGVLAQKLETNWRLELR
jgi:hypothetical protein